MGAIGDVSRLLAGSPYSEIKIVPDSTPDPVRFFCGAGGTVADLRAGWAIARPLAYKGKDIAFATYCKALSGSGPGVVHVLLAPPGEGKTTLLRQISLTLSDSTLVLTWRSLNQHRPDLLRDLVALGCDLVLTAEVPPTLSVIAFAELARLVSDDPLPCPLVIAGSPAPVGEVRVKGAVPVRFGRLTREEAPQLVERLRHLAESASPEMQRELNVTMPNLLRFAADPKPEVFLEDAPLMVGLLRATYGEDFRSRLKAEYDDIGKRDPKLQAAYRLACQLHAVGLMVPLGWLRQLDLGSELDALLAHPGTSVLRLFDARQGRRLVGTRHPVVAKTVLQEANLLRPSSIASLINDVSEIADPAVGPDRELFCRLINGYERFVPMSGTDTQLRGDVRKAVRSGLFQASAWLRDARAAIRTDTANTEAGSWAHMLHCLWPAKVAKKLADEEHFVIVESAEWLEVAEVAATPPVLRRIAYWRWKAKWALAQAEGAEGSFVDETIEELRSWLGDPSLGADFYTDFITAAIRGLLPRHPRSENLRIMIASAYEYAIALAGGPHLRPWYGRFLSESAAVLRQEEPGALLRLLSAAWDVSRSVDRQNAVTGTWLGEELLAKGVDELGTAVLKEVLASRAYGEALYTLAGLCRQRRDVVEYVLTYLQDNHEQILRGNALDRAYAFHAAALCHRAEKDGEKELDALNSACAAYSLGVASDPRNWQIHGEDRWREALHRLHTLAPGAAGPSLESWQLLRAQQLKRAGYHG